MIFCSAKRLKELKDQAMAKQSAGILLFRSSHELQILLVHPGGPFWAKKDEGSWSIPKGEYDEAEDALAAAKRELREEPGIVVAGEFLELGTYIPFGHSGVTNSSAAMRAKRLPMPCFWAMKWST